MRAVLAALTVLAAGPACGQAILPQNFALAAQYSRDHGGDGMRVEQFGKLAGEDYAKGFSAGSPHKLYSGTKNFVAVGVLIAAQEGLLDLDEPACLTLTEWRTDGRRAITIRELLHQTSGLGTGNDVIYEARDQIAAAVRVHLVDPPGTRFHYGPSNYQALGEILRRKLRASHRSVEGFLRDRVFNPLDIDIADWKHDDAGQPMLHTGLMLTLEEWCKFGRMILAGGRARFGPLIDPQLFPQLFVGTRANPAYGLGFWLNHRVPHTQPIRDLLVAIDGEQIYPGGPTDIVAAEGAGKQRLYIIPSRGLIIARFGWQTAFSDGDFLSRLLTGQPHPDAHSH
jgi:CubicO group peptidase (beta-lactamase class C family)